MKNIKLYKVEWTEGYDKAVEHKSQKSNGIRDAEHDVTYDTILSWFAADTKVRDSLRIASNDYEKELRIVRDLPRGCMYDLHHGSVTPAVMRFTTTTDIEQGYCQIDGGTGAGGAVYECWYPKNRTFWNGWACPAGLTAKSLCDFLAVSLEGRSSEVDIELCTELLTSIVPQEYGDLTIYGIGDGLIWDECTADGNVDVYRADDEGRCGECMSYGTLGTTCNVCKRGVYVNEEAE